MADPTPSCAESDDRDRSADAPPRIDGEIDSLVVARALFDMRHHRHGYFDEYCATDGGFSILLSMYCDTAAEATTPIAKVIAASDAPLSTALYILGVLIDAGQVKQVGAAGEEHYSLTTRAEHVMERYLLHSRDHFRRAAAIKR